MWCELTIFLKWLIILETVNCPTELFWVLICKNRQFCISFIKDLVNGTFGTFYEKRSVDVAGHILKRPFFRTIQGKSYNIGANKDGKVTNVCLISRNNPYIITLWAANFPRKICSFFWRVAPWPQIDQLITYYLTWSNAYTKSGFSAYASHEGRSCQRKPF